MICISLVTAYGKSKQKPLTVQLSRVRMVTSCSDLLEATRGMSNCKREISSKINTLIRFDVIRVFKALNNLGWDTFGLSSNQPNKQTNT